MNHYRRKIIFDVDGVILDFSGPFSVFWNKGLLEGRWEGVRFEANPKTWRMGLEEHDDRSELDRAIAIFYKEHDHLPLLNPMIPEVFRVLRSRDFEIDLVTAYPDEAKRIANLQHHEVPYDNLICDVHDKAAHVKALLSQGATISAVVEDGPHHLQRYLTHFEFPLKIYAPYRWNYLQPLHGHPHIYFYEKETDWFRIMNPDF